MNFDLKSIEGMPQDAPEEITKLLDDRVAEMSNKEWRQFRAAFELNPHSDLADVAALTFHLHNFNFFYPVDNDAELGYEVAKYELGAREDVLPFLDHAKIGTEWREKYGGVFIDGAFVQQCSDDDAERIAALADEICAGNIPREMNWSAKVQVEGPDGTTAWLRLPDYEPVNGGQGDEIRVLLFDYGAVSLAEFKLLDAHCILTQITDLAAQYDELEKLVRDANNLGYILDERGQGMRWFDEKFCAALDHEQCDRLDFALDITQNLHCYDYAPDDPEYLEEMGRGLVHNSRNNYNQTIKDAIDYVALAESHLLNNKGHHKIDGGFFKRNENEFAYAFSQAPPVQDVAFRDPAEMSPEETSTALDKKLEQGMQNYIDHLAGLHSSKILALGDEIAATKFAYDELKGSSGKFAEYLLRFENPLEVVRDAWLHESNTTHDEEFFHAMWGLMDKGAAEQDYSLDPAYTPPEPEPVSYAEQTGEMTMEM